MKTKRQLIQAGQIKLTKKKVKAKPAKLPKVIPPSEKIVEVVLTIGHQINSTMYGPGTVKVPAKIAAVLREQERRFMESEESFHATDRAFMIGAGNRKIRVHPDAFNAAWTEGAVFHGVAGGGRYQ